MNPRTFITRFVVLVVLAVCALPTPEARAQTPEPISLVVEIPGQGPFADDDGSVFEHDIATLEAAGIVSGCAVGRFCPDDPITRGEMAALIRRARPELFEVTGLSPFEDTAGSAFETDIAALAVTGVTSGCGGARYCPDVPVTRAQMAAFIHRTFADSFTPAGQSVAFADTAGHVFEADIDWLARTGVTAGCHDGSSFCPEDLVTRGQMAAFLRRALRLPQVELSDTVLIDLSIPTAPGVEGWELLVSHFFGAADVPTAMAIIACESKGDPNASSPYSSASGLFQHLASRFPARADAAGYEGSSVFDPVANVAVAAFLVERDGWWHWNASRSCWS